jgi:hypothetical protein
VRLGSTFRTRWFASSFARRDIRQPKTRQRHATQRDAKLFQRLPSSGRLGQFLGQFIEFFVHDFPFLLACDYVCAHRCDLHTTSAKPPFFEKILKKWLIDCVSLVMSKTGSV